MNHLLQQYSFVYICCKVVNFTREASNLSFLWNTQLLSSVYSSVSQSEHVLNIHQSFYFIFLLAPALDRWNVIILPSAAWNRQTQHSFFSKERLNNSSVCVCVCKVIKFGRFYLWITGCEQINSSVQKLSCRGKIPVSVGFFELF